MTFPGAWTAAGSSGEERAGACRWHSGSSPVSGTLAGVAHFRGHVSGASWAPPVSSRGATWAERLCRGPEWASRGTCPSPDRGLPSSAAQAFPALLVSTGLWRLSRTCLALPRALASWPTTSARSVLSGPTQKGACVP